MSEEQQEPKDQKTPRTPADAEVLRLSRRQTRRSFAVAAAAAAAGYGVYRWLDGRETAGLQSPPLRAMLNANGAINRAVFNDRGLAPTYRPDQAEVLRVNGTVGLDQDIVLAGWRLQMTGVAGAERMPQYVNDVTAYEYQYVDSGAPQPSMLDPKLGAKAGPPSVSISATINPPADATPSIADRFNQMARATQHRRIRGDDQAGPSDSALYDGTPGLLLTMGDLDKLPRAELITQFKCIEGWSQIVHWRGIRLRDLMDAYPPAPRPNGSLPKYVYMETPDGFYYTGYDLAACRHPQAILATEMSGAPLRQEHGAPLRLHMPTMYGYKQIKRIGLIAYTDMKPDDYWTKLGYDWYAGL